MVVDPRLVAGRRRHDRRVQPDRPDGRRRDRDRPLHARVLADRRVAVGRGDADGHASDGTRAGYHRVVPAWTPDPDRFPRFALLDGPSPLAPLPRLTAALGGRTEIWIKREDLLPLAFGGNKLRSLEYLVGAALAEGADCLVTTGRRWSNHARLTAAAGARAGLAVHLVLSGPPTDPPNPGIALDELLGATIHQAATADRAERDGPPRAGRRRPARRRVAGRPSSRPVVAASRARSARSSAGLELLADGAARGVAFDDVVVPSATGGTQAGLLVGVRTGGSRDDRPWRGGHPGRRAPHGRHRASWPVSPPCPASRPSPKRDIVIDDDPARRRLRPADRGGRRGDPAPRPDRGHPRRPDLHREGTGRARRAGPVRPARRPARRLLARRRDARPVRAARPG